MRKKVQAPERPTIEVYHDTFIHHSAGSNGEMGSFSHVTPGQNTTAIKLGSVEENDVHANDEPAPPSPLKKMVQTLPVSTCNYEELVRLNRREITYDTDQELVHIPQDDCVVEHYERELRTSEPPIPVSILQKSDIPIDVKLVMRSYTSPQTSVVYNYAHHSKTDSYYEQMVDIREREEDKFEIDDAVDATSSVGTPGLNRKATITSDARRRDSYLSTSASSIDDYVQNKFINQIPEAEAFDFGSAQTNLSLQVSQVLSRPSALLIAPYGHPRRPKSLSTGRTTRAVPPCSAASDEIIRFRIDFQNFVLAMPTTAEPFFMSASLHDIEHGKRISEEFHLDFNSDATRAKVGMPGENAHWATTSRTAIFNITPRDRLDDLVVIIKIEKTFNGDVNQGIEPYSDPSANKLYEKYAHSIEVPMSTLRQPFAWCAFPLSAPVGESELSSIEPTRQITLYRPETDRYSYENLYKVLLLTLKKKMDLNTKKPRVLYGHLEVCVRRLNPADLVESCLTPWLGHVSALVSDGDRPIREIQEFDSHLTSSYGEFCNFLYIYPKKIDFSKRGAHTRNIVVKIEILPHEGGEPAKLIYGRSNTDIMQTSYYSTVLYHNKQPDLTDEVKILLPSRLTAEHHIKVTFSHATTNKKKGKDLPTAPIGYSVLPLREAMGNLLEDGIRNLPVAQELSTGYLSVTRNGSVGVDGTKWLDNGKPLFQVGVKGMTIVHAQSPYVLSFLTKSAMARNQFDKNSETALLAATMILGNQKMDNIQIYRFLPVIMDRLLWIICNDWTLPALPRGAFNTLVYVLALCHTIPTSSADGFSPLMDHFIREMVDTLSDTTALIHSAIVQQWVNADFRGNAELATETRKNCRHLFDIIVKSMAIHSQSTSEINVISTADQKNISILCERIGADIQEFSQKSLNLAKRINEAFAYFVQSCFTCMNRSYAFSIARNHAQTITNNSSEVLLGLKLDFLAIICAHEHYVPLNLPLLSFQNTMNPAEYTWNNAEYHNKHALASLLIGEVVIMLRHTEKNIRMRSVEVLRDHLGRLGRDTRYSSKSCQQRIALLHFPLLLFVLDNVTELYKLKKNEKSETASRSSTSRAKVKERGLFEYEETRDVLACFMSILGQLELSFLQRWWDQEKVGRLFALVDVLHVCVTIFEYRSQRSDKLTMKGTKKSFGTYTSGETKQRIEEQYINMSHHGARKRLQARRAMQDEKMSLGTCDSINEDSYSNFEYRSRKDQPELQRVVSVQCVAIVLSSISRLLLNTRWSTEFGQNQPQMAPRLPSNMIRIVDQPSSTATYSRLFVQQKCLAVLCTILTLNQSQVTLAMTFAQLRHLCEEYPHILFDESTENCALVATLLLNHGFSTFPLVREQAAATIYSLAQVNYKFSGSLNFMRLKMQLTMALSKTIISYPVKAPNLAFTLTLSNSFGQKDQSASKHFKTSFQDMMFNLYAILDNTLRMKKHRDDPDMYVDLMYSIANGYASSPVLRYTWLENIEKFHAQRGYWAESAMCTLHMCALVADYLHGTHPQHYRPQGSKAFNIVSPNAADEIAEVQLESVMEVRNNRSFTESNLVKMLERLVADLKKAELLELAGSVYKLLIPIYENGRAWNFLQVAYEHLSELYKNVITITNSQKRILGTYFRVKFVGDCFEDVDGAEYVYKEPTVTTLAEVSLRLKGFFGAKYGVDKVVLLQDSNPIDVNTLDPEMAYIQITHVAPYFDENERLDRLTDFERSVNMSRFVFEAPYTLSGKAHGSIEEQYKRKTILTTRKAFPYIRRRISVVRTETIDLTPVDVAIEAIQRKTAELAAVVLSKDIKLLQLILSGAVNATVNEGPLAMAKAFLIENDTDTRAGRHDEEKRSVLQSAFATFLQEGGRAVDLNTQMCLENQQAYAQDLDEKYSAMLEDFRPYLMNIPMPLVRRKIAFPHTNSISLQKSQAYPSLSTVGFS